MSFDDMFANVTKFDSQLAFAKLDAFLLGLGIDAKEKITTNLHMQAAYYTYLKDGYQFDFTYLSDWNKFYLTITPLWVSERAIFDWRGKFPTRQITNLQDIEDYFKAVVADKNAIKKKFP